MLLRFFIIIEIHAEVDILHLLNRAIHFGIDYVNLTEFRKTFGSLS